MTQKDKDLLLKDLCARLPYRVKVEIKNVSKICTLEEIDLSWEEMSVAVRHENGELNGYDFDLAKPYLFPLSSMTAEQKREYAHILTYTSNIDMIQITGESTYDWLNKNMFDWRGLIPKGLANDATGLNIY